MLTETNIGTERQTFKLQDLTCVCGILKAIELLAAVQPRAGSVGEMLTKEYKI